MFKNNHSIGFSMKPAYRASNGPQGETVNRGNTLKMVNLLSLIAVAVLIVSSALPVKALPAAQTSPFTFTASGDAQVTEAAASKNYGNTTYLQVDGNRGANVESYILFNVSGLEGTVTNALLRVYNKGNGSSKGPVLYGTDTSWTETAITWSNRPPRTTSEFGNVDAVGENAWVEYDVTAYVTGDGAYSFALATDGNDGLTFSSREDTQPPQLVVTTAIEALPTQDAGQEADPAISAAAATSAILVGAGDISSCDNNNDEATAKLLDKISGTVFTVGDNAYTSGSTTQYNNCYDPTWGRLKSRTKPVPGNHEYKTSGASGYFKYFNNIPSYYAYNLGSWRIYALNSEIGISSTSAQVKWLKADLAANPKQCVLAYWHRPRWSSGSEHGSSSDIQALWSTLYDAGAELIISGHDHGYERFTQMNASGSAVSKGMREIVVGTGGASHYSFGTILSTSQVHNSSTYGVLKLTLNATGYDWQFIPVAGKTFTDNGSTSCR